MSIISIFGLAGTGTSSCGKLLAEKLRYNFISAGNIVRQIASERGLDLHEYEKVLNSNSDLDKEFDDKIEKIGKEQNNLVIDSRLAWYFIPHSIKIKFVCDDTVRFNRICARENISFEKVREVTLFRENSHAKRYDEIYGISKYDADEHFDLIIDTTNISVDEVVDKIFEYLKAR